MIPITLQDVGLLLLLTRVKLLLEVLFDHGQRCWLWLGVAMSTALDGNRLLFGQLFKEARDDGLTTSVFALLPFGHVVDGDFHLGLSHVVHEVGLPVLPQFGVLSVQVRLLGHPANELPRPELPDLHVLVDDLVLALIAEALQKLVALDVGLNNLAIGFQELYLPQLFEDLGVEHEDFCVSIVRDDPVLRVVGDSVVAIVAQDLSFRVLGEVEWLQETT